MVSWCFLYIHRVWIKFTSQRAIPLIKFQVAAAPLPPWPFLDPRSDLLLPGCSRMITISKVSEKNKCNIILDIVCSQVWFDLQYPKCIKVSEKNLQATFGTPPWLSMAEKSGKRCVKSFETCWNVQTSEESHAMSGAFIVHSPLLLTCAWDTGYIDSFIDA